MDNLENVEDYYQLPSDIDEVVLLTATATNQSAMMTLILDSGSTLNMVSNKDLLHGIHKVPVGIRVKCNAGITTLNKKGYL
jgi:hypothetical protein